MGPPVERADGLVIGQASDTRGLAHCFMQYELLPPWIQEKTDRDFFICLEESFYLGVGQASSLQDGHPVWMQMHVGGVDGQVYAVGRSPEPHLLSFVQMLTAKRNYLRDACANGRSIQVHDPEAGNGYPRFILVPPGESDIFCIKAQMEGVRAVFREGVDDWRVRVLLDRALAGDTFQRQPLLPELPDGNGNGYGE